MDAQTYSTGMDAKRLDRITDFLNSNYVSPGKITGCQLAITRHGQPAYFKSFGQMDRERNKATSEDTIYRIYSMTKPVTAVALMTLYEKGLFQLNDPVQRYLPDWRGGHRVWVSGEGASMVTEPARRPISFRDILSHMAGFTYGASVPGSPSRHCIDTAYRDLGIRWVDSSDSMQAFLQRMSKAPLRHHPGEGWNYSLASDVAGALVEVISGRKFGDYLKEVIFDPLEMKDTSFAIDPAKQGRFAANYKIDADGSLYLYDDPATSTYTGADRFQSGGGGLLGTTPDYMRFCEMLRRGGELDGQRILGPRTLDLMRRNHLGQGRTLKDMVYDPRPDRSFSGLGFGLGFATTLDEVEAGVFGATDYYWAGVASTLFWVDQREQMSVVFMTQLMNGPYDFRSELKNLVYASIVD